MKGPGMRLDLDVRRLWRCPACSTQRLTPGRVTFVRCHFCMDHPAMVLVEQPRPSRSPRPPLDLIIDLHPDDVNAPAFVPLHLREPEPGPEPVPVLEESAATPPTELNIESTPAPAPDEATAAEPASVEPASVEPPADVPPADEAVAAEADAAVVQQVPGSASAAEVVEAADPDDASPARNRKKRRSRRQRRRNRSAGPGGAPQSGPADAPPPRPSAESSGAGTAT